MCHVAQVTSRYLCGQLLAVTIDLADSIVTVCRLVGHGARLDYIIAAGVALLLSDLGTLLEQEFDLLLKTVDKTIEKWDNRRQRESGELK